MGAGRPYNSTTPAWRSKPAIKVRMYHFLCYIAHKKPTKYDCARYMKISRTTAIKWFDAMKWSKERDAEYWEVKKWVIRVIKYGKVCQYSPEQCSKELGYSVDDIRLDMEMMKIEYRYGIF